MTNTIEKIEDIEVTNEMVDAIEEHCYNTYPEKCNKYLYRNVLFSITNIAIQASTQIQNLIAENKRLKSEILKLVAELVILKDENEWQPIDTAPEQILVMVWQKYNNEWGIWWGHKVANDWFVKFGNEWLQSQPTHWQPLPQPPKDLK